MAGALRRAAIIGGARIPFARSNTACAGGMGVTAILEAV